MCQLNQGKERIWTLPLLRPDPKMKTIEITITEAHNDAAARERDEGWNVCECCPTAQSLREKYPEAHVGYVSANLKKGHNRRTRYSLPLELEEHVRIWTTTMDHRFTGTFTLKKEAYPL